MMMTANTDTKRLTAYIPADLHRWLKVRSRQENRTVSNFVETLIRSLKSQETAHDD